MTGISLPSNQQPRAWQASSSLSTRLGVGAPHQELRHQGDGASGRPLGVARYRGGAGDVQMRPWVRLGEARQEARRGDRAGWAATDVRHVGEVALELALVLVEQR